MISHPQRIVRTALYCHEASYIACSKNLIENFNSNPFVVWWLQTALHIRKEQASTIDESTCPTPEIVKLRGTTGDTNCQRMARSFKFRHQVYDHSAPLRHGSVPLAGLMYIVSITVNSPFFRFRVSVLTLISARDVPLNESQQGNGNSDKNLSCRIDIDQIGLLAFVSWCCLYLDPSNSPYSDHRHYQRRLTFPTIGCGVFIATIATHPDLRGLPMRVWRNLGATGARLLTLLIKGLLGSELCHRNDA